ncbi:hypothetical protein [Tautonia plasticadhaerens]|uniref:Amphi-Trp domain-containing protein n=1 Tax=Tautonia plasticadhaerens TaxID=2527974 RepID=A0A518GZA1_9BACT|nr:hypothetical protein [Tautonia plasticadhaerens]QDV33925.1 hypothetical protein ElP_18060 [Tautonia plasticadhaerens]
MTMTASRAPRRRRTTGRAATPVGTSPASLEQTLRALVAMAGGTPPPSPGDDGPGGFETWDDGESAYIEARLSAGDLPDIDLSSHGDRVVIRITWPSRDEDDEEGPAED